MYIYNLVLLLINKILSCLPEGRGDNGFSKLWDSILRMVLLDCRCSFSQPLLLGASGISSSISWIFRISSSVSNKHLEFAFSFLMSAFLLATFPPLAHLKENTSFRLLWKGCFETTFDLEQFWSMLFLWYKHYVILNTSYCPFDSLVSQSGHLCRSQENIKVRQAGVWKEPIFC